MHQPVSQTISAGGNVTPRVAVSGSGPFSYQWQFNRTNLPNHLITTVAGNRSEGYSGVVGAAINASLNSPFGEAVDASGNLFIADEDNERIRNVALVVFPILTLDNVFASNTGNYQVIVTSPYGSVTSAVANVTVLVPLAIVMNAPLISANNLLLGFSRSNSSTPLSLCSKPQTSPGLGRPTPPRSSRRSPRAAGTNSPSQRPIRSNFTG